MSINIEVRGRLYCRADSVPMFRVLNTGGDGQWLSVESSYERCLDDNGYRFVIKEPSWQMPYVVTAGNFEILFHPKTFFKITNRFGPKEAEAFWERAFVCKPAHLVKFSEMITKSRWNGAKKTWARQQLARLAQN